jgi:glycerol kinase
VSGPVAPGPVAGPDRARDHLVLAIDQGTSSTRTLAFDAELQVVATAERRLAVGHPRPGWSEQDPLEILASVVDTVAEVLGVVGGRERVAAVGLDNQGETVVAWDARDGRPLAPAVLWQCRRSEPIVHRLADEGLGPAITERTGLPLDPYFSAGKLRWLLDEVPEVAAAAHAGTLRFGTVDAWLTARLDGVPRTDPSTASRTQLFSLAGRAWDPELADWFGVPLDALPSVVPSAGSLGEIGHPAWGGPLPLRAMLCDQQAALAGHGCVEPGQLKATYGTGAFVLANAGASVDRRPPGLLTTIAWSIDPGRATYAFDGGVFSAGSLLDWLAGMRVIDDGPDADRLAATVPDSAGVTILPALGGLGAPWWDGAARGAITGITGATTRSHVARAALDAIAHRVADIVEAMTPALPSPPDRLRVDGGLSRSAVLVQRQADLLGIPVEVADNDESTALGVAAMAQVGAGLRSLASLRSMSGQGQEIVPSITPDRRLDERRRWRRHVEAVSAVTA